MKPVPPMLVMLGLLSSELYAADTRYVTDQFEVMLRSGTSTQNTIVRMLSSGTAVEVLGDEPVDGYVRIQLPSGTEGWVLSRYLMRAPAARDQLATARAQVEQTDAQLRQLAQEFGSLERTAEELSAEKELLETENRRLNRELEEIRQASADVLLVKDENVTLRQRMNVTERDLTVLKDENTLLRSEGTRQKWIAGAGIMLAGIFLGVVLPRLRWRRRANDW